MWNAWIHDLDQFHYQIAKSLMDGIGNQIDRGRCLKVGKIFEQRVLRTNWIAWRAPDLGFLEQHAACEEEEVFRDHIGTLEGMAGLA